MEKQERQRSALIEKQKHFWWYARLYCQNWKRSHQNLCKVLAETQELHQGPTWSTEMHPWLVMTWWRKCSANEEAPPWNETRGVGGAGWSGSTRGTETTLTWSLDKDQNNFIFAFKFNCWSRGKGQLGYAMWLLSIMCLRERGSAWPSWPDGLVPLVPELGLQLRWREEPVRDGRASLYTSEETL